MDELVFFLLLTSPQTFVNLNKGERMNKKQKFKKICNMLSNKGRFNLVYMPYSDNPMAMNILYLEIMADTKLGKKVLKELVKGEE